MSKTTFMTVIKDIDKQNFNQAVERLSYIKPNIIKTAANYEIILRIIVGNTIEYHIY